MATAPSPTSRKRPASLAPRISAPARPGWITTRTATWISSSPTTCNGPSSPTSIARSTAKANPIARLNPTKALRSGSGTIAGTAPSKTLRKRLASAIPLPKRSASPSSTTTTMAGPTCSFRTIHSPTSSIATTATAPSPRKPSLPASPSAKTAWHARAWASMPLITITPVHPASSSPISPTRCFRSITTKAAVSSWTKRRDRQLAALPCFFFDYDLDGWSDIFIANGHIDSDIERVQPNVKYAMPPHLFRNAGKGNFQEVTQSLGRSFATPRVGRGAAYADINNDGRLDLLFSTNGGPAYLFLNEATGAANKSLRVKLAGTKSNRDGIGAIVKISSGGATQTQMLRSGSSYLSASELVLTFGLGQSDKVDTLEVRWPSGQIDRLSAIPAGQTISITETKGLTASCKFGLH